MLSQKRKKHVAWVLIVALLNLVLVGVPGSGAVLAATHAGMSMDPLSMNSSDCHAQASMSMEMVDQLSQDEPCPECGDGCSLCFQITMAIPIIDNGVAQLPQTFAETDHPRLRGISSELILPPPRPL